MSTTFEIGRWPARKSRERSHCGEGPIVTFSNRCRRTAGSPRGRRSGSPPSRDAAETVLRPVPRTGRGGRDLAREAVDRLQVRPVARGLDEEHVVDERQDVEERRPRLGLGQEHDPGVVGAEPDLVLGEDHPVGDPRLAPHGVELEPVRQRARREGRRRRWRRRRSSRRRTRSTRLALADVTSVIWSRSAFGCFSASSTRPTLKSARLPSSSATPRRSILHLGGRDREPRRQARRATSRRDVVAQPRDGNAHQNCLMTQHEVASQRARMSGMSCRSWAVRSRPQPNANPLHSSGRAPRSRTRAGRPCRRRPSRSSP